MRITDTVLRQNWKNYLLQPLWGTGIIMLFLSLADFILSETIIASLGASIFIASTIPLSKLATPRYFIGSYSCSIVSGIFGFFLSVWFAAFPIAIFAGFAVGLTIFLTVLLNFEHPPAAALALGLVLSQKPFTAALIAFGCIIITCLILHFTKRWMKNLL